MALIDSVEVNAAGSDRKLISSRTEVNMVNFFWRETLTEKIYQWWGLTQNAAEGAADTADQSECEYDETASYECAIDNRVIGSYTLTKTITEISRSEW